VGGKTQAARQGVRTYRIDKTETGYTATVTVDGSKSETLSETTFAKGYKACVEHARAQVTAEAA
jgi:hypothetical protein